MHKFIMSALLLLVILLAAASVYNGLTGGFKGDVQGTIIELAILSAMVAFVSALLFHLLMTFLKYKNQLKYDTLKVHLVSGLLLGLVIAFVVGILSFSTRWQKGEPIGFVDFEFFVFYPLLGLLTGLLYKLIKD